MTNPPPQPTVADAVRLMDSLSTSALCSPANETTAKLWTSNSDVAETHRAPPLSLKKGGSNDSMSEELGDSTASRLDTLAADGQEEEPNHAREGIYLPAEIILQIAMHLLPALPHHESGGHHPSVSFPCEHASPPYASLTFGSAGLALSSLLSLATASRSFRNTLTPLIWHTIVIRTPQHLPRLSALLKNYDTLSILSRSPPSTETRNPSLRYCSRELREGAGLRHPLPHIRSIVVSIPDKYADLDQTFLLTLLRSMHLTETRQLEHLSWSAEAVPNPAIWTLVGPSLRSLEVDGRTFYQGHGGWGGLERLQTLRMVGYESTLLPSGVVALFQAQRKLYDGSGNQSKWEELREVPEELHGAMQRGRDERPLIELQRSTATSAKRQAQHLYLDPSPQIPIAALQCVSSSSLPSTSSSNGNHNRLGLQHLSLSSSKTSLLHQPALISSLCFVGLTCLDIYAVTPEPPLASAILSCSTTLTHLRLVLDISGAFANFDALWTSLTGKLPALIWLQLDPMPQQNTAPSFSTFVHQCAKLRHINARKVNNLTPYFDSFHPSHPSETLPA